MRQALHRALLRGAGALFSAAAKVRGETAAQVVTRSFEEAARDVVRDRAPSQEAEAPAGFVAVEPRGMMPGALGNDMGSALLLVRGDRFLPIFVGPSEALAFRHRLEGPPFKRPLPYDLLDELLRLTGGRVVRAQIIALRDGAFHAELVLEHDGAEHVLDCRASDATILAMGAGVPIVASNEVMAQASRPLPT